MSDPLLHPYARQYFGSIALSRDTTVPDRVRELIEVLLPTGRCSIEQVARSLGVDRRTVHRHLSASGESFSAPPERYAHPARGAARGEPAPLADRDLRAAGVLRTERPSQRRPWPRSPWPTACSGHAPGPATAGVLADRMGLLGALRAVPLVAVAAGAAFIIGKLRYEKDLRHLGLLPDVALRNLEPQS
ncbi:hypothetical protein [Streptomyces sparsogenes]|uniref:hypothetical protein n=1 Tax=Streptomyces sparsogenes TaxID=67365 RepID=UPI001FE132EC|nr:hypothetical protein [Streptomyces sparsogenes]